MDGGTMTDRPNNRASDYALALIFSPDITLRRFNEIIEMLEDEDIDLDYATLDISSDGIFAEARYDGHEGICDLIDSIDGVYLDEETMCEWMEGEYD